MESAQERCDTSTIIQTSERCERVGFLMHRIKWIKLNRSSTLYGMMFLFHKRPTHFKDWKPFNYKGKKHHQIHNLGRYSVSVDNFFFTLPFVYTLICLRRDFNLKRKTKIINMFKIKFIYGMANLQMKTCKENLTTSVLKITKAKIPLKKIKIR